MSLFATSIQAVASGLRFAFVPATFISQQLQQQRLGSLHLAHGTKRILNLSIMLTEQSHAGPAVKAVFEQLIATGVKP